MTQNNAMPFGRFVKTEEVLGITLMVWSSHYFTYINLRQHIVATTFCHTHKGQQSKAHKNIAGTPCYGMLWNAASLLV